MGRKSCAVGLCLAVIAAMAIAAPPAEAQTNQTKKKPHVYTAQPDPVNRPRARVTVAPRSFLDAGTEVLPGERKFTDYAFPVGPYSTPLATVQNTRADAWAGINRPCLGRSTFPAATIRSGGNSAFAFTRASLEPQSAVMFAARAVSVQFLRSPAIVR